MCVHSQHEKVFIGARETIQEKNKVEFRLLYEGELLPSAGTKKRAAEKHAIRRAFHPQLRRLWNIKENLQSLAASSWLSTLTDEECDDHQIYQTAPPLHEQSKLGLTALGRKWARGGFNLVPLVTAELSLRCSIDITLLRPEEDRLIFKAGDIDGQLKTIFDALRIPDSTDETGGMLPQEDEDPLFCLLQDNKLISEVRVNTDTMLLLPNTREVKANDAHAIIHVKLNHKTARTFDNYFG